MGALADSIRRAVREERYVFGAHADQRLRERRIPGWQVVAGLESGKLVQERPGAAPNPVVEFEQTLPDGSPIRCVWAWISMDRTAKLVTAYFVDR